MSGSFGVAAHATWGYRNASAVRASRVQARTQTMAKIMHCGGSYCKSESCDIEFRQLRGIFPPSLLQSASLLARPSSAGSKGWKGPPIPATVSAEKANTSLKFRLPSIIFPKAGRAVFFDSGPSLAPLIPSFLFSRATR